MSDEKRETWEEESCGIAQNVTISTNEDIHLTAKTVQPSGELLSEWEILSPDSRAKVKKWFDLSCQYLQGILDAGTRKCRARGAKVSDEKRETSEGARETFNIRHRKKRNGSQVQEAVEDWFEDCGVEP